MLKRPGRPAEVAAAILFLASDGASSYVTGALTFMDGDVGLADLRIARSPLAH